MLHARVLPGVAALLTVSLIIAACSGGNGTTASPAASTAARPPATTATATVGSTVAAATPTTTAIGGTATGTAAASGTPTATARATTATATAAAGVVRQSKIGNFQLESMTIKAGTTVVWTNADSPISHTVTGDKNEFDSGEFTTDSYRHAFDRAGLFAYHCILHPTMTGIITVQ